MGFIKTERFLLCSITALFFFSTSSSKANDLRDVLVYKVPLTGQALFLSQTFHEASKKYNVPFEILWAVGWVESRWSMRSGKASSDFAYGIMGLRSSNKCKSLDQAISLTGFDLDAVKTDMKTNIYAAAALLADIATKKIFLLQF